MQYNFVLAIDKSSLVSNVQYNKYFVRHSCLAVIPQAQNETYQAWKIFVILCSVQ